MSNDSHRLRSYLEHIVDAIERIKRYTGDLDEIGFIHDELIQDAVIRNLEIIGEASNNIEKRHPEFAESHPELPLAAAYQMRNSIAHGYFKVDIEIVWRTIQRDLPGLHRRVNELLR